MATMLLVFATAIGIVVLAMWREGKSVSDLPAAYREIGRALHGLLGDRRELALFALFEIMAIGAVALLIIAVGPRTSGTVLIVGAFLLILFVIMRPPAQKR